MQKWEKNKEEFSKYGKFSTILLGKKVDFFPSLHFDADSFVDSIGYEESIGFIFPIALIPATKKDVDICLEKFPNEFYNGFFWGGFLSLNYDIKNGKLINIQIFIEGNDDEIGIGLNTRRISYLLKKHLLICFEQGHNYDSGYTDEKNMYKKILNTLKETEFIIDYNYTMEDIHNDIKNYPLNKLYSE